MEAVRAAEQGWCVRSVLRRAGLDNRAFLREYTSIDGGHNEWQRVPQETEKYAKTHNLEVAFVAHRGKGSHGTVYLGDRFTVLKDRKKEIGTGLYNSMLDDLGIKDKI